MHTHEMIYRSRSSALALTAVNPDAYLNAWSQNPRLQSIMLYYRKAGMGSWIAALNENGSPVTFAYAVTAV